MQQMRSAMRRMTTATLAAAHHLDARFVKHSQVIPVSYWLLVATGVAVGGTFFYAMKQELVVSLREFSQKQEMTLKEASQKQETSLKEASMVHEFSLKEFSLKQETSLKELSLSLRELKMLVEEERSARLAREKAGKVV